MWYLGRRYIRHLGAKRKDRPRSRRNGVYVDACVTSRHIVFRRIMDYDLAETLTRRSTA